jgi:hypothetical protein
VIPGCSGKHLVAQHDFGRSVTLIVQPERNNSPVKVPLMARVNECGTVLPGSSRVNLVIAVA